MNAAEFHPCAISVALVTPTRYEIVYRHRVKEGFCLVCKEPVPWPFKTQYPWDKPKIDVGPCDA